MYGCIYINGIPTAIRQDYRPNTPGVSRLTRAEYAALLAIPPATAPASIPPEIEAHAARIAAAWARTGLPLPADWESARAALKAHRQAASAADQTTILEQAAELLSLILELYQLGGTWSQVLELASNSEL